MYAMFSGAASPRRKVWDVICLMLPCGFQDLSGKVIITNLPLANVQVPLQRSECKRRQVDILHGGLRVFFREVAVADEEPHHLEVSSFPPFVHFEAAEVEGDWKFAAMVIDRSTMAPENYLKSTIFPRFCLFGLTLYTILTTFILLTSAPHIVVA